MRCSILVTVDELQQVRKYRELDKLARQCQYCSHYHQTRRTTINWAIKLYPRANASIVLNQLLRKYYFVHSMFLPSTLDVFVSPRVRPLSFCYRQRRVWPNRTTPSTAASGLTGTQHAMNLVVQQQGCGSCKGLTPH